MNPLDISTDWAERTLRSMDNYLAGAESMGQSERERQSFIIVEAKEDAASVTKTTHSYLSPGFIVEHRNPQKLFIIR